MSLKYCTFTGVDENTNLSKLIEISKDFPFVEWGILYTDKIKMKTDILEFHLLNILPKE